MAFPSWASSTVTLVEQVVVRNSVMIFIIMSLFFLANRIFSLKIFTRCHIECSAEFMSAPCIHRPNIYDAGNGILTKRNNITRKTDSHRILPRTCSTNTFCSIGNCNSSFMISIYFVEMFLFVVQNASDCIENPFSGGTGTANRQNKEPRLWQSKLHCKEHGLQPLSESVCRFFVPRSMSFSKWSREFWTFVVRRYAAFESQLREQSVRARQTY